MNKFSARFFFCTHHEDAGALLLLDGEFLLLGGDFVREAMALHACKGGKGYGVNIFNTMQHIRRIIQVKG